MEAFRQYLMQRPETVIGVVTHWGVIEALTGKSYYNCELGSSYLSDMNVQSSCA